MSVVYFVSSGPSIKIGTSTNLRSRFASLQTSSGDKLTLISTIPGGIELEQEIHRDLKQYRQRGEWFLDCKEVRLAINKLCGSDVFAPTITAPARPTPMQESLHSRLFSILLDTKRRYLDFSKFCLEKCETDRDSRLWRLHVTKRYLITAAISQAQSAIESDGDNFLLGHDPSKEIDCVGRCVASAELCECHVEIILGDDIWFLEGWERRPRSNPLFETAGGKVIWQTKDEAAAGGWIEPPNSFQVLIRPWLLELLDEAA